jgi:FkbM family methyltransferase
MISHSNKLFAREIARKIGLEVAPSNLNTRFDLRLKYLLDTLNPDYLLDVGANRGQFAGQVFTSGFKGTMVSFEALPHVYGELTKKAEAYGGRWKVAPRFVLSDSDGSVTFHVSNNFASSSMLEFTEYSTERSVALQEREAIEVQTRRLDDLLPEMGIEPQRPFLKLDVQGAEHKVLAGGTSILERAQGVLCEVLLVPFYEGQASWREIDAFIIQRGFDLWDLNPVMRVMETGQLEALDLVYVRRK